MTDIETYEPEGVTELQEWARDLKTAYVIAASLVKTSFVPDSYRNRPEEAAAAIMMGQELGLSPLASLRSIDVIKGTPGLRAIGLRALVQSHGHEIWTVESTATQAIVRGKRKGSDKVEQSVWTMDRAQKLGLSSNDNYRKQPIAMLLARATSECARLVDADGLLGVPYSTEELQDLEPDVEMEAKPVKRTVKRRLAAVVDEPDVPDAHLEIEGPNAVVEPFEGDPTGMTEDEAAAMEAEQ